MKELFSSKLTFKERVYWFLRNRYTSYIQYYHPRLLADLLYHDLYNKWIDWDNPQTLDEKINWLEFYTDTSLWTKCADKYRVREYVKSKGLEDILIPLYGKWDRADEIEFDKLPNKFVLKPNNGHTDLIIVKDKSKLCRKKAVEQLSLSGADQFLKSAEPHYLYIKPCIIAEMLLETDNPLGLVDYKIKVFNGRPFCIGTWANRTQMTDQGDFGIYDLDWNPKYEWISAGSMNNTLIPKPKRLDEMLEYATILGRDFEQVRVDFYEVDGRVYFGEMTFTSSGGRDTDYTSEAQLIMGQHIELDFSKKVKRHWNLKEVMRENR